MIEAQRATGWGKSGLSDRQRIRLIVVALFDLLFLAVVVLFLGGLMSVTADACPLDRIPVCDESVASAFRFNAVGQAAVFGAAAAVAVVARTFKVKIAALAVAPVLGVLVFTIANSSITSH